MLKIVGLVEKRDDFTMEEFEEYWKETHQPLVTSKIEQVQKYTISIPLDPDSSPYDGIANLYFESIEDIKEAFAGDRATDIREDEENFTKSVTTITLSEDVQLDKLSDD